MQAFGNLQLEIALSHPAGLQQPTPGLPQVASVAQPRVQNWFLLVSTMQSYPEPQVVLPLQPLPALPSLGRHS